MSLCKEYFQSPDSPEVPLKHLPTPGAVSPSPALTGHAHSTRKDIVQLIRELEESKGFLQRLADSLCRVPVLYDQEMQSDTCWNGSAVGRYMKSVPEANMISQVKHNSEVTVTLLVDRGILLIKDTLTHMRRVSKYHL
ncbi:uncharacterized protein LOC101855739 [Aplysia californica]|uniref:Uncharacterized protein LOC101855739 n=1 Tax=Aplysia californica TaxID=6500 RepID=A0ABM0JY46_APLCA|nr:uncharacterized protein LOC101855739 [Aplysia californica]